MKKNQGFTLIELLVVIAIIGILSSVVLASLNTARGKGADAAIKSTLANTRAAAEMVYDASNGSYATVCDSTTFVEAKKAVDKASGGTATCIANAGSWALSSKLKSAEGHWCVDWMGASKQVSTATTDTTCPNS